MTAASTSPLLLLPGLICDARIFAAQLAQFGNATAINGFGARTSLVDMARHVLDTAPPQFSLLGHSMGARVALEVVRLAPARVTRLALLSTGTHAVRPGEAAKRLRLVALGRSDGAAALVEEWLPPMLAPAHRADPAIIEPLRTMCRQQGVTVFAAQIDALLSRPDLDTLLPAIRCPTLIAAGEADEWSPPAQHALIRDVVPGARLIIVPGSGHMLPVEAPAALNDAIADWLSLPILH